MFFVGYGTGGFGKLIFHPISLIFMPEETEARDEAGLK
jgi:hypothetical protein